MEIHIRKIVKELDIEMDVIMVVIIIIISSYLLKTTLFFCKFCIFSIHERFTVLKYLILSLSWQDKGCRLVGRSLCYYNIVTSTVL